MAKEGFQFTESAARRILDAVRKVERMPTPSPIGPKRGQLPLDYEMTWYRIVTNEAAGEYTVRKQQWGPVTNELEDISDTGDPVYNIDQTAYDCLLRAGGSVSQIVKGWQILVDGEWVLLVDVGDSFWARITGNTSLGANQYTYSWENVLKTAAGYDGWAAGTLTGTDDAYNTIEDINTGGAGHVEGCGVDVDNLDTVEYTFAIMPCTTGNVVRMREVRFTVGETDYVEYWFAHENGVDGTCD